MDSLAGYGSSSEDESGNEQVVTAVSDTRTDPRSTLTDEDYDQISEEIVEVAIGPTSS